MNKTILKWLNENVGNIIESPRRKSFDSKTHPIKIIKIDEEKQILVIKFVEGTQCPPLHFWMFERALDYIRRKENEVVRLGTKVAPPYDEDTIEGQIWCKPFSKPPKSPFKASPHICDILVLSLLGKAKYEWFIKSETNRKVQGIRYITENEVPPDPPSPPSPDGIRYFPKNNVLTTPSPPDPKQEFINKYTATIIDWTKNKKEIIKDARFSYTWKNKPMLVCVKERNEVSKAIIMSRIRNQGGLDLDTLDKVTMWGFNREFPLRNREKVIKRTKKAFNHLDEGNLVEATKILLNIFGVGISRASKIIGLFDQENLCIYDSRVGNALEDFKYQDKKIILCPAGRNRSGDNVINDYVWAEQYQRLVWSLEIVRDYLNERGNTFRLADVEMALFMIGK